MSRCFPSALGRAAAVLPFLVVPACVITVGDGWWEPDVWVEAEQRLVLPADDLATVACTTHNGTIQVHAGHGGPIDVIVRKRAGGADDADAAACMQAVEILQTRAGDEVAFGWQWAGSRRSTWRADVSFEIEAPADLAVRAQSHNGAVTLRGVCGGSTVNTHNGPVRIQSGAGPAHATAHNGSITVAADTHDVRIQTYNGPIALDVLGGGSLQGSVTSHNGAISITAGDAVSAKLVCSTNNGAVNVHRPVSRLTRSRRHAVAELGEAETEVQVATHNGSITIDG